MLRSIGSVTALALFMVGCDGGGGGDSGPPPPPPASYTVGGTVTGLAGSGLVLNSDFGGDLPVSASGSFTFGTRLPDGSTFNVSVKNQPTSSNCQVANGTGAIAAANVTNVDVTCASGDYTVGGTVSGLVGSGLTLAICHPTPRSCLTSGDLQISANGAFTLAYGYPASYSGGNVVIIVRQPSSPTQRCVINNAAVSIQAANDTSVTVSCTAYAYVTNAVDNTVSAYSIDATTGALAIVGAPTPTGLSPFATVGLEYGNNRYVFVGNEDSNDISAFAVDNTTGALTAIRGSPFAAGTDPKAMALTWGNGSHYGIYVANAVSNDVFAYDFDGNSGLLTGPATAASGNSPTSIIGDGNGLAVFVANHGGSNDISAFWWYLGPWPRSPFPAGGNPLSLAVGGAIGQFLYSANPDAKKPSISGFSIDPTTTALSPLSGSPFPLPVSNYIATDHTGAYLYVTWGASVVGYRIDATTGALTALPGFPIATDANAYSITIDPTNQFLYVVNDGAGNISGFKLDASTGALTPMGSPFPAGKHPKFITTF